jgi:hypothetical protein
MSLAGEGNSEWVPYMFVFLAARLSGVLGEIEKARGLFGQAEGGARRMSDMRTVYSCRSEMAHMLRKHGEIDEALELYKQVLPKWKEMGHRAAVAHELECIAFILIQKKQPERAATLLSAAQVIRELIDSTMTPPERIDYERVVADLRASMSEDKFKQLWDAGRSMSMEQAIEFALG